MVVDKSENNVKKAADMKSENQAKQTSREMGDDKRKHIQRRQMAIG